MRNMRMISLVFFAPFALKKLLLEPATVQMD
jgi:hypothetical protein